MAKRVARWWVIVILMSIVAAACSSNPPDVIAADDTQDTDTTSIGTSAVTDDSATIERDVPLSELVTNERLLGRMWIIGPNEAVEQDTRIIFYGSRQDPILRIEAACGVGTLELDERGPDVFVSNASSWEGCASVDAIRTLFDAAETVAATFTTEVGDDLVIQVGEVEFSLTLVDLLGSFTVNEAGYPVWEIPEAEADDNVLTDFRPLPQLPDAIFENEPLLANMTLIEELEDDPELLSYLAIIASASYALVDDQGEPIVIENRSNNKLQLLMSAYHGADSPVVYLVFMEYFSLIDPTYGPQSIGCDGGIFLGGLNRSDDRYELSREIQPVFDNRLFFGDYECGGIELDPLPEALEGSFGIDITDDGVLIASSESGASARFALID